MQIGRWNHQGGGASSRNGGYSSPRPYRRLSRSFGPRRRSGVASREENRYFSRGGYRSGNRGGFGGSFGKTAADLAKLINRAEITEKVEHFVPEHKFSDFQVDERLKKNIAAKGYELPTPIQDRVIPHILRGEDVVGLAETGTGKTAAFLVPLIEKILKRPKERVLVMAPTRELAVQIERELAGFAKGLGFRGMVAVGGANINPQISQLRHNPSFVIGTPGRLKDLMERRSLDLSGFGTVVLDEADRMLDMGFIDDMRFILGCMQGERHTLFFSATLGKDIERLIGDFLKSPVRISVKTRDTPKNIEQDIVRIPRGVDKLEVLAGLLKTPDFTRVLIFGRTKHGVKKLAKLLSRMHIHAESIHGNKSHNARERALRDFKEGKVQALVATDVAARGLDIPDVSHVINYDLPGTYEDYIHRVGRTGRHVAKGKALTFVQE